MTHDEFVGTWSLVASKHISNMQFEVDEDNEDWEVSSEEVVEWLRGRALTDLVDLNDDSGLKLFINEDLSFTEVKSGSSNIITLNAEGVHSNSSDREDFFGIIKVFGEQYFIEPIQFPAYVEMSDQYTYGIHTRVFDDCYATDRLFIHDGKLIRVVNQITDMLYLDRLIYVYEKEAN